MRFFFAICVMLLAGPALFTSARAQPQHGLAMHGTLKYPSDFTHFDYVNPDAPKGGELRLADQGPFDSLNPFITKGQTPDGAALPFDTLMDSAADEPFSEYGLIAETVETPPDRAWVIFTLRPQARWHDGQPITADDVIFSLETLRTKGAPHYRFYYAGVDKMEKLGERRVKFSFKPGDNRELPLILGQLPILPKHYWQGKTFDETTLVPPLGSGPYRVGKFEPGRFITYERVTDYWAKDMPTQRGRYNFDRIRYDVYRDATVALEALKAGEYDLRLENESKKWATGYSDWDAVKTGKAVLREFRHAMPSGMQGYAFNLRRPLFSDVRVREALAQAFDFEWANRNLFYGQYARTNSYFDNSELAAKGLPGADELALLEPLRAQVPPQVFSQEYQSPPTDPNLGIRPNLRRAVALLEQAGWQVVDGKLVDAGGQPFRFEILLNSPAFERITLPFARNLKRLGIDANVRTVDPTQYVNRVREFDFDMIVMSWGQSLSPGNEQSMYWSSEAADQPGSRNVGGIRNKAIDTLIDKVIAAPDRRQLVAATRALDRVLLWNWYVIPQWHSPVIRVALWDKFGQPDVVPMQGWQMHALWAKNAGGK
ncbi:putative oligopeptide transporter subunit; periplasmic-binding component of ABC superfamily transporter [Magnetospirillum gryphiswaldense MSR-1 v2]|uniref:Oligopeptide transporter subunit periplasmic-binding component of ABC superfamily transporter n=1 Tax=Magnetospirillum gryphiswaldense (strain DSM 6361 / JCM 21280 / NBRC 15271 / MSR-1) TaxID=431944 RepID=V6F8T2_MAGGM|nr:extracellular solute-binding protein [Magnetospirillum gryphiswaldense]CDL01086.1 putative oligopeptide transporter subunit; periplasmic-binding component of ABC superfamily transporter [Magnetospirillum gryphiswaldense MSR-1 v2]